MKAHVPQTFPRTKTETEIAHELFHLQLRATCYQENVRAVLVERVSQRYPWPSDAPEPDIKDAAHLLLDIIQQHRVFYPKMRKMGLDPSKSLRQDLESAMRDNTLSTDQVALAYVDIALTTSDTSFLKKYESWAKNSGHRGELEKGEKITHQILAAPQLYDDPGVAAKTIYSCFQTLWSRPPTATCRKQWSASDVTERLERLGVSADRAEELGELYGHCRDRQTVPKRKPYCTT